MKLLGIVLVGLAVALSAVAPCTATDVYAGRWDSTMYNMSDHPHTVALRIVVEDSETRLPLAGVELTIEGEYEQQSGVGSAEPRESERRALTGRDGDAIFGLPSNESVSYTKNNVMFWQSWKNSRHGIMVVINPEDRVTRIEKD